MKRKTLVIFIILITILNTIMPVTKAAIEISKAGLTNDHKINTHILYYNEERKQWRDVQCGYICYQIEGEKYPAYCIMPNTDGVDEEGPYTVTINDLLKDKLIYNVLINGYPYKKPSQLGVETVDDAYVATKLAVKNALLGRDIKSFYKAKDEKGEKIINAIYEIAEKGKAGNASNKVAEVSINKVGGLTENGEYYYQEYNVTSNVNISEYNVENIENFPEGTYIASSDGTRKNEFLSGENFKVMIPKTALGKDIEGNINVKVQCNSNPIFYGEAPNSNIQDYAVTYKPYVEYEKDTTAYWKTDTAGIKILKIDEQTDYPIKGVEFGLYNEDNEYITSQTTNSEGIALFYNLYQGKYLIKEVTANENYVKDENIYEINTEYNKEVSRTITNTHKKGNLKITKVDKDDKTITLGAIEFDLIDEKGNIIEHLITDVNGEAYVQNINTGTYTLKETKTKREYNLCENTNIVVEWNKTSDIVIENEKKKGKIKIVKVDAEKEDIKVEGVKFQIIDTNDRVIEEIKTNENGEAISSKLLIGEYKVKEIDLGSNTNYLLNNEIYTLKVENEEVTEITVENIHKKGNLKIKKIDKDNSNIVLESIGFEITDEDGYTYEVETNKDGIAEVEGIRVGKVKIKETKTKEEYVLESGIYETEIKYDEWSEIIIENEKKKGQVEIYKFDKDNKNIKISDVEFEIIDKYNQIIDKIKTDKNGYAISKRLPIGEYYLKEVKTNTNYVLNEEIIKINIKEDEVLKLNIENEKIKGKIQIIKTSSNDSPILDIKKGDSLQGVEFDIFNKDGELVDTIVTDENGRSISKDLEIGRYKVKEKNTNKYYILNTNEFIVNIEKNNEIKVLEVENEAVVPNLDIEKTGQLYAEKNEEIKYEFDIKNISNTELNNFTWTEYIPYEDCKITKIVTGIYNQNLGYEIFYKTNKNDYRLFKTVNSLTSEYLSFDALNLEKDELITEVKVEYKTVSKDFNAIVKPAIFTKINNDVKKGDKIINITKLSGNIEEYVVEDKSSFETIITEKEILKKLPKTGC